jgi:Ni/Fe-hydrogenase subunit HybB-like protein
MTVRSVAISLAVTLVMAWISTIVYGISWESALVLAPVFVIGAALVGGLAVIWYKAARDNLRGR